MSKIKKFIKRNKMFSLLVVAAIAIILVGILAPVIATHSPYESNLHDAFIAPNSEHIFGTDKLGRDIFSRVIYGTRISLSAALILVILIFTIGTTLGVIAGYFGGIIDTIIMRISDMMISFPGLVLAIAMAGIMGASVKNAIIAITVVSWTKYARLSRSLVLKIKETDYIRAAKVTGCKTVHIITRHIIPNIISTLIITATTDIGTMILELSALSFLGFGAQSPQAEWGLMLNEGRAYMVDCPWLMIYPGLAICIVVIVYNLLGDNLRDILDSRSHIEELEIEEAI
ncbi:MAG: ABC transporter permease [Clostridiales bacterium]|nr:ABC transporter permease [Clostridiales bacterium]